VALAISTIHHGQLVHQNCCSSRPQFRDITWMRSPFKHWKIHVFESSETSTLRLTFMNTQMLCETFQPRRYRTKFQSYRIWGLSEGQRQNGQMIH
jgi:hypothetical protein